MNKLGTTCAMLAAALLISACNPGVHSVQEKIAVVNWEQAVSAHPDYSRLQQGEKILADLVSKRKGQENLAKAQLSSLNKLRGLRQLSQQSFLTADFNTQMVNLRERENMKTQKFIAEAEAEVDAELGPRKKEIEDSYQLRIFNLRAVLESVKLKPLERKAVEQELAAAQRERGSRIHALQAERKAMLDARVQPYLAASQQRLADEGAKLHAKLASELQAPDERDKEMLSAAPQALNNALSIMDREIDKQQEKNEQLQKQINSDIESQSVRLAHERSYSIVFNKFKVNLKADDITDTVIQALKKDKK